MFILKCLVFYGCATNLEKVFYRIPLTRWKIYYRRPIEDPLPRTIENVRIRATIQRTINQVSALVGALSRPTTSRAPRGAAAATPRRKRKSTTRKPASGSSAKKRKTSTKRKSVKRKRWSSCAFWILELWLTYKMSHVAPLISNFIQNIHLWV